MNKAFSLKILTKQECWEDDDGYDTVNVDQVPKGQVSYETSTSTGGEWKRSCHYPVILYLSVLCCNNRF